MNRTVHVSQHLVNCGKHQIAEHRIQHTDIRPVKMVDSTISLDVSMLNSVFCNLIGKQNFSVDTKHNIG